MTFTVTESEHPTHSAPPELRIDGYGGAADDSGDFNHLTLSIPFGAPDAMYELAQQLVMSANRWRDQLVERSPQSALRGPYVLAPARKRTPEEANQQAADLAKDIASKVGAADAVEITVENPGVIAESGARPISEVEFGEKHPGARRAAREHDYLSMAAGKLVEFCGTNAARWAAAFGQVILRGKVAQVTTAEGALGTPLVSRIDEGVMLAWFATVIEETKRVISPPPARCTHADCHWEGPPTDAIGATSQPCYPACGRVL